MRKIIKTNSNGFIFNVVETDWMGSDLIGGKLWEPHITQFMLNELKSDSVFVDVGSCYGYHTILASKLCKKVYSFEPQKFIFDIQTSNLRDNNITNVSLINKALGNEKRTVQLTNFESNNEYVNVGEVNVVLDSEGDLTIEMDKLDNIIEDEVKLIKIDVQGFEKYVLEGGHNIIKKDKPYLIVEFENYQLGKFGYNSDELFEYIKNIGYSIFLLDYHYPSDFLCVHKNQLSEFEKNNKSNIHKIYDDNSLNNCLKNEIDKKIFYSSQITNNTIKKFDFFNEKT